MVNQVAGATVADWNADATGLTVTFLEPIATDTSFVVTGEMRAPREGAVVIPIVRIPAAERETGGIAVDVVGAGEINERQPRNMEPADASDLGDIIAGHESPSMAAFQFAPLAQAARRERSPSTCRDIPRRRFSSRTWRKHDTRRSRAKTARSLVRARYAVRNNQRSFLAVTLPPQASLWSASLAGRPVRPGLTADGGLLLPLQKGRSGEEAPTFIVELTYIQRGAAWTEKGDAHVELPTSDLPVSRSVLALHFSPRYAVDARPGPFRVTTDPGPWRGDLRLSSSTPRRCRPPRRPARARKRICRR